jgi:hypothetical protein
MAEFDKEISRYSNDINTRVQKYTQNELLKKWEVYKFDYGQELAKHGQEMQSNLNTFNAENIKLQTELQIAQANAAQVNAALTNKMSMATELEKHNALQEAQASLNKWTQDLGNYQAKLGKVTSEANIQNSEYSLKASKFQQDMADSMNTFNTTLQNKTKEYEWIHARMKQLESEYNQGIGLMAQPREKGD